ncbi:MAG: D-glycero-alpha-D-manno-heptose-1,7-bisphosphate 7-phosphatase [Bdellovibrionales bacterium]
MIILDRDGVLNQMVIDAEHGTIDSPMNPEQVKLVPGATEAVAQLTRWGFKISICTNQPSAAKGKTTIPNLKATHARVVALLEEAGGKINSSHMCLHRSEDKCACRKPNPGMLREALAAQSVLPNAAWMVGDGVTDVQAGAAAGVKTAFLGSKRCDVCTTLDKVGAKPDLHVVDLSEFVVEFGRLIGLKISS